MVTTPARLRYGIAGSPLGRLLVAGTERGVCAISLGDAAEDVEAALMRDCARDFPGVTPRLDGAGLAPWIGAVQVYLSGAAHQLDLPLDVTGTGFQRQVWDALRTVPYGQTITYLELSRRVSGPAAVRAVAQACAANRVAIAIPCHRAVQVDGGLGGYRWGLERKRRLLELERGVRRPALPLIGD
jgi:AraC family transcriptional regulator of adaptative response/methylated-DNA-[protein]-cysteine methyltransferase